MRISCLLALCLPVAQCVAANGEPTVPEQPYFEDLPVVLSVSRLPQSLADTPGALTVIDRETIRATGYRRLPDLLRLVPGFNVAWQRGWHGVVNYHGFSDERPNRVLVLIDGRPMNSEYFSGGVDWASLALDLDDIDRIEVLRGSNSAAYGTNAFLGVINIRTRPASQTRGVYLSATRGDHGIADQTVRLGGGFGPVDLRLTFNQIEDDGLDRLLDDSRHRFANLRADLRLTDTDELTLDLGEVRGRAGEGFGNDPFENPFRVRRIENSRQQLRWRHVISAEDEFSLQYFRNRDRYIDDIPVPDFVKLLLGVPLDVNINLSRATVKEGLEFQHFLRLSPALRAVWGLEWRRDEATSETFFSNSAPVTSNTQRLFGNVEWRPLTDLAINVGAMAERVSVTGTAVSPRLFVNYQFIPGHTVRGGVSTATRAPTLFEVFGRPRFTTVTGNRDLDREKITAYELGYFGKLNDYHLQADVRVFEERLSGLIGTVPLPETERPLETRYANLETARTRGASYQLKWSPLPSSQFTLNQAYTRISQPQARLERSAPTHSTSLMWTQQLPGSLSFSLIHYRVGAMEWLGFGDLLPSYRRTDARLSYGFRAAGMRGDFSLVGLNLFDRYSEFRVGREPETHVFGRRTYATLRLEF